MLALIASMLLFVDETEQVKDLLAKAGPANAKEVRIEALESLKGSKPKNPKAVCQTLEQYLNDKDPEIRSQVLVTLGLNALEAKLECPLSIVEAIDDEEPIRSHARGLVFLFNTFPKAATPLIFQAAESKDAELRDFAATSLSQVAGKTPKVVKKLKQMMNDPDEFVRHAAHVGHYAATKDFETYLTHLFAMTSDLNPPHPIETESQKRDQTRRNLLGLAAGTFFYESTRERPKELAEVVMKSLSHQDARVRQCALRQLRAMCISSRDSYQAIPKDKALTAVQKLRDDKNEEVSTWAYMAESALTDGPPPDAPQKLKPLNTSDFLKTTDDSKPVPSSDQPNQKK